MRGFKTFEEQVEILKERNLIIEDEEKVIQILASENYYNIINGYKYPFIDKKSSVESFIKGCTFEEIYALYDFDRNLRNILFKSILQIENVLRTQIAYVFSKYHDSTSNLCYSDFETLLNVGDEKPLTERATNIYYLLSKIQQDISNSIKYKSYIKHYVFDYGYIPMWVLVNAIPLNRLSSFFRYMNQSERIEVSQYWGIMEKDLRQYIALLAVFRNLCAHDERLYCTREIVKIPDNEIHIILNIPKDRSGNFSKGKCDLFALMIIFKKLLKKEEFTNLYNKVNGRIISLETKLKCIEIKLILELMGFPENWKEIKMS